jgi:hypothetical protein
MKKALLALVVFSLFSGVAASEAQAGLLRGCNRCCCVRWMPRRYYCPPTVCEPAAAEPVRQKKDLVEVNVTFEDEPRKLLLEIYEDLTVRGKLLPESGQK